MLIHIFQIIPITLLLSNYSKAYLINPGPAFPEFFFLALTSVLTFLSSLNTESRVSRNIFIFSLSALYLFLINKLYQTPSLGILLSSIYILTLFKLKAHRPSKTPPSSYSVLWPFLISIAIFSILRFELYQSLEITLLAANLSFASLVFFVGVKAKIINSSRVVAGLFIVLSALTLLFLKKIEELQLITDIWFAAASLLSMIILFKYNDKGFSKINKNLFKFPEATIFSYFIFFALLGSFLLALPMSRAIAEPFSFLDSFFTAMSAICVTGLIVLDTPIDFSFFGQTVILSLIQLGGFGIVAMSSWILLGLQSTRMSVEHEQVLKQLSGHKPSLVGMQSTLRRIFLYFFAFECAGTLILFQRFLFYDSDSGRALWRALFTSVSAFCNAGFALQSDSLIPYQNDKLILATVSTLIIAGGFAPLMALSLPRKLWRGKLNLQEKLVLYSTAGLLALGFLYFAFAEWNHSLNNLSFIDKIVNSWFQSVTTRTAGFNSVDFSELAGVTPFFFMILMFIGGNPGGAAGGIKTVTFAIIVLGAFAGIRGENHIRVFNRHIASKGVYRTLAIFSVAFLTLAIAFFMLSTTQSIPIISILFETVSAIGTVGLSIGATGALDEVGKVIIILCMLLGRVGPMAFILLLFRSQTRSSWKVPKEDVYIS